MIASPQNLLTPGFIMMPTLVARGQEEPAFAQGTIGHVVIPCLWPGAVATERETTVIGLVLSGLGPADRCEVSPVDNQVASAFFRWSEAVDTAASNVRLLLSVLEKLVTDSYGFDDELPPEADCYYKRLGTEGDIEVAVGALVTWVRKRPGGRGTPSVTTSHRTHPAAGRLVASHLAALEVAADLLHWLDMEARARRFQLTG